MASTAETPSPAENTKTPESKDSIITEAKRRIQSLMAEMGFKKWEKPGKPNTPTPEGPGKPDLKPEGPGIPNIPNTSTPEGPGKPTITPESPGTNIWVSSTPGSVNWEVPQNIIPQNGEGGRTEWFTPSPDAPPAWPGAVWVGSPKPTPNNTPYNPFE